MSYEKLNKYINKMYNSENKNSFLEAILPQMKAIALDVVKATYL